MRRSSSHDDPAPLLEKRRRSPPERKELDYERQRRGSSQPPHSFRHGKWRKKRRAAQKPERQGAAQRLRALIGPTAGEDALADVTLPVRNRLAKWGATKLRDWVSGRLERRANRFAWRLLRADYDTATHREPFAAALRALTAGRRTAIAARFDFLLRVMDEGSPPCEPVRYWGARGEREARWLRGFFADEPAWEQRLREGTYPLPGATISGRPRSTAPSGPPEDAPPHAGLRAARRAGAAR